MTVTVDDAMSARLLNAAKSNEENFGDGAIIFNMPTASEEINRYELLIPAANLKSLAGRDERIITPAAALAIPASLIDKLIAAGGNMGVTLEKEAQAFGVNLTLDAKSIDPAAFKEKASLNLPLSGVKGREEGLVICYLKDGALIPLVGSYLKDGSISAQIAASGFYQAVDNGKTFADTQGKWMDKAVYYLSARNIINGVDDNSFAPARFVSRAEFTALLMRTLEGLYVDWETTNSAPLNDVSADAWYYDAVNRAYAAGIVSGTGNGKFVPDAAVTRQDMFVILHNALTKAALLKPAPDKNALNSFSDRANIASYAEEALTVLAAAELIKGDAGMLKPSDTASRGEAAQLLYNALSSVFD
jgi:hypothetical protein